MPTFICKRKLISAFILSFFSVSAFSAPGHFYVGSSLGASFADLDKHSPSISYFSGTLITDDYPLNDDDATASIFSLNGGYEFMGAGWRPAIMLGAGVYTNLADYDYNGQLVETVQGNRGTTLYDYHYHLDSFRVMGEAQLTWMLGRISPFINLGIGPAWNHIGGYKETAVTSNGYTALPPFESDTNTNFAYQLGFGLSTGFNFSNVNDDFWHERISIGYRYANLGETSFDTRGSAYPHELHVGRFTTNDIYLNFTHLF